LLAVTTMFSSISVFATETETNDGFLDELGAVEEDLDDVEPILVQELGNDTNVTATQINVNTPITAGLTTKSDVDWYKFTVAKAGYIQISLGPASGTDTSYIDSGWTWQLYWSNATSEIASCSGIKTSYTSDQFPQKQGETFYVKISHTNSYYDTIGANYTLKVINVENAHYEKEENDVNTAANQIAVNTTYKGNCYYDNDVDWFVFDITKAGYFTVTLSSDASNDTSKIGSGWRFDVYSSANLSSSIFYASGIQSSYTSWKLAYKPGRYYVKITNKSDYYWTNRLLYNLKVTEVESSKWEKEENDTNPTATKIATGSTFYGVTNYNSDADWFKVDITKTGYFQVQLSSDASNNSEEIQDGWDLSVYSGDALNYSIYTVKGIKSSNVPLELPYPKGTYYIKVEPHSIYYPPCGCVYDLKVTQTTSSNWESEYNDSSDKADKAKLYNGYNGYLRYNEDEDWYKVSVPADGKISLTLKNVANVDASNGWKVILYSAENVSASILSFTVRSASGSESIEVEKGTYYICIKADSIYYAPVQTKYMITTDFQYWAPDIKSITNISSTSVKLSWDKVANVEGYQIYRSTSKNGTYKKIATVTGYKTTTYTDKSLTTGKTYYYKIRAYGTIEGKTRTGAYSDKKSVKVVPPKGKILSVSAATKAFTVKWKTDSSVSGYEIQYSTSSSFKSGSATKTKTVSNKDTSNKKITSLKAKTTYYVRVRSFKTVNGKKVYGSWSTKSSVKTK